LYPIAQWRLGIEPWLYLVVSPTPWPLGYQATEVAQSKFSRQGVPGGRSRDTEARRARLVLVRGTTICGASDDRSARDKVRVCTRSLRYVGVAVARTLWAVSAIYSIRDPLRHWKPVE